MKTYTGIFNAVLLLNLLVCSNVVYAAQKTNIGFISLFDKNAYVKEFGIDVLLDNNSINVDLDFDIKEESYRNFVKIYKEPNHQFVHVTHKDLTEYDVKYDDLVMSKKLQVTLNEIGSKYKLDKVVVFSKRNIRRELTFYAHTQYGTFERQFGKNISGYGFHIVGGSTLNKKMNKNRLLFATMTANMHIYDVKSQKITFNKSVNYLKSIVLNKVYDDEYKEEIVKYVTDGYPTGSIADKYRGILNSDNIDIEAVKKLYERELGSLDEFDDLMDELNNILADPYEYVRHFKVLSSSVKKVMKEHIYTALDNIFLEYKSKYKIVKHL